MSDVDSTCNIGESTADKNRLSLKPVGSNLNVNSSGSGSIATTTTSVSATTNALNSTNSNNNTVTTTTAAANPLVSVSSTGPVTGTDQDVKWNAAPTLLERQRENLTARLRREFGLCVSDDDEEKSGKIANLRVRLFVVQNMQLLSVIV